MRPTGRLHIGHYFGALQNWVRLQSDAAYECFYFVADWHALTSDYADTSGIAENTLQIAIDFLASGLDPEKSVIFVQSLVPEHAELHLLLSMVTPLGWLERVPTYKEQLENIKNKDLHTYGFLGYPTLQTADITMYSKPGKGLVIPVGEDQVSHVEFSRELVRKFNFHYGLQIAPALFEPRKSKDAPPVARILAHVKGAVTVTDPPGFTATAMATRRAELENLIRDHAMEVGVSNFLDSLSGDLRSFFSFTSVLEEPEATEPDEVLRDLELAESADGAGEEA
jgi:tryptophanyl-tRNA synthetase